ncbi:MAG: hypothetical protein ABFS38_21150 [Bacteroidota bacterium]
MRPQLHLTLLFISVLSLSVLAQEDMTHYFDDGGIATSYRLFKVGYDPVNGEIPVMFEHRIGRHVSIEWGTGLVSLKRQAKLYEEIETPSGTGYNVWANLRIYLKGYYERFYMGFQPRISFLAGKSYTDIVFFNAGYQRPIYGRLVFDINAGMGVRSYKEDDTVINTVVYENGRGSAFFIPLQFKIGYAF